MLNDRGRRPHFLITDQPADLGGSDPTPPNRAARRERDRRLLPLKGCADHYKVSVQTIERWGGLGRFPIYATRIGYLADLNEIDAAMAASGGRMRDGRRQKFGPAARIEPLSIEVDQ